MRGTQSSKSIVYTSVIALWCVAGAVGIADGALMEALVAEAQARLIGGVQ